MYGKDTIEEAKKLYMTFRSYPHYDCRMEAVDSLEMAEDKPLYIMREIMAGDFVFICVSPILKEIFDAGIKEGGMCMCPHMWGRGQGLCSWLEVAQLRNCTSAIHENIQTGGIK